MLKDCGPRTTTHNPINLENVIKCEKLVQPRQSRSMRPDLIDRENSIRRKSIQRRKDPRNAGAASKQKVADQTRRREQGEGSRNAGAASKEKVADQARILE